MRIPQPDLVPLWVAVNPLLCNVAARVSGPQECLDHRLRNVTCVGDRNAGVWTTGVCIVVGIAACCCTIQGCIEGGAGFNICTEGFSTDV